MPGFIRSPPTLAVCDVAHSVLSLRMRPEGISHTFLVLLESSFVLLLKIISNLNLFLLDLHLVYYSKIDN
jgi:hypothetical protein